ncbi:MAG: NAD(+) synthase, partial [bacterium]|nr:NAD(+) synthase [Candidatus Colisoma equi]
VYALAAAGIGESTSDALYGGGSLIAEAGRAVAEMPHFSEGGLLTADADVEALRYRRRAESSVRAMAADVTSSSRLVKVDIPRSDTEGTARLKDLSVSQHPFLDEFGEPGWIDKLLTIQAVALARRMETAHVTKLVLGLSGGADSALALLGASRAIERLMHLSNPSNLSNPSLLAIVMPGLASSEKTQRRAVALAKALGVEVRVIDICEACRRHLRDIGHDETVHDIVFENVQARERTQVLMDLANQEGALVVGTGDLSEIALGWNTYNGDHMSMYQINASVPKTMVLAALKGVATLCKGRSAALLREIAEAPITPELVPGAAVGDSEARLGPYELHDFFLYHFLANGASRNKLKVLGKIAFRGRYDEATVERTCETFWRRFFTSQYKRNCVPDGPKITLSLSPRADWRMPSDAEMT